MGEKGQVFLTFSRASISAISCTAIKPNLKKSKIEMLLFLLWHFKNCKYYKLKWMKIARSRHAVTSKTIKSVFKADGSFIEFLKIFSKMNMCTKL